MKILRSKYTQYKVIPVLGSPIPVLGLKVKRDESVIRLILKITFKQPSMKRSRRELSINMVDDRFILKK